MKKEEERKILSEREEDQLEKAEELRIIGTQRIESEHYAVDSIQSKCVELIQMRRCLHYSHHSPSVLSHFINVVTSRNALKRLNKWCTEGVELLVSQQIERCQAPEFVVEALRELDEFLASSDHGRLGSSRQLKTIFEDVITPETKGLVHQVLKRIEDVQMMCEKRKSSLKKLATRLPRPRPDQNLPFLSINLFRANPLLPPPLPAVHTLTLHLHSMLIFPSHLRTSSWDMAGNGMSGSGGSISSSSSEGRPGGEGGSSRRSVRRSTDTSLGDIPEEEEESWSSDYSASDEEEDQTFSESTEVGFLRLVVQYVRVAGMPYEGWTPATYLERVLKKGSRSSPSVSSQESSSGLKHATSRQV
ncbi:hypothetical protein Pmani_028234 [Petrolisthes manimaculis]|uniref:Guanine nucleotide exchange factor DBS-like spectrin-like domain-containing protein n=1 Tax=Petrolisthes manimaculis TaxID=1843537 RepID=A0AAE1NZX2_9EUCA|nr:hypothetical protein Pmani_028234 [Petrolisthes manimaculis]